MVTKKMALLAGAFAAIIIAARSAHPAAAAVPCDFQNGLQELSQKEDSYRNDGSLDNLRSELAARKTVISQVLDCAIGDAATLQSGIASLSINDSDIKNIQNRLLSKFDDAINYYRFQKTLINDLGIEGSKRFSRSLKEWRASSYEPFAELGTNFVIFAKNQELFQTTGNRLNQIKRTLQALKLTDNETVQGLLRSAEDSFGKAKEDNSRAEEIFKRLSWPNDSSSLIKSSLEYLKETYQNFFDIRNEVGR